MIEYEWVQKQDRVPPDKFQGFYWSKRGKLVKVDDVRKVTQLLSEGFIPASEAELQRFAPGDYLPAYDSGPIQVVGIVPKDNVSSEDTLEMMVL